MKCLPLSIVVACALVPTTFGGELRNDRYRLTIADDGSHVEVHVAGMPMQTLRPTFDVIANREDPGYTRYSSHPNYPIAPRIAIRWRANSWSAKEVNRVLNDGNYRRAGIFGEVTSDADGEWTWQYRDAKGKPTIKVTGPRAKETINPWAAGKSTSVRVAGAPHVAGRVIHWSFADEGDFQFAAEFELPPGDADPLVRFSLTPKAEAYYAVLFTGMPRFLYELTRLVPQECAHRGGVIHDFVLCESDMHLPRAHVAVLDANVALVADPRESPFRLPNPTDSRFGLMLSNEYDEIQPVLMAPLFGGAESHRKPGEAYSFTMRAVFRPGDWKETFRHIAQNIYGVHDERDNSGPGSLNGTIERIIDFLTRSGNPAFWHEEQKYYDYYVDQSNVFKPFSPLFGLSAAIITDNKYFYLARALPAVEFALSRKYNLFAPYEGVSYSNIGSAKSAVGGPYIGYAQLLALDELLQRRSPAVLALAEEKGPTEGNVSDLLAKYRRFGDAAALDEAKQRCASMIDRGAVSSEAAFFDLLELYDVTRDERHLKGVVDAAYHRLTTVNMFPQSPDATVVADPGGRAPIHFHSFGRHKNVWGFPPPVPVQIDEQHVPAWRLSRVGVPSIAYPMEYWMNYYGGLMRAAALADDDLLRATARNGMVGRFGHFPGDNRSQPSLIGERPDVPDRPPWQWNFTTMNPCHAWDFVAWLIDFLVSDAFDRSKGAIDFPAETTAGSNFRCRVYGARPGKFYGDENVRLWMPRGLVQCDNKQFDWLAGYGNGQLYFAFWNQSSREETATVLLNRYLVSLGGMSDEQQARTWRNNQPGPATTIRDGSFRVVVPPKGIVALAVPGSVESLDYVAKRPVIMKAPELNEQSFGKVQASFGTVHGMLLLNSDDRFTAFIYTDAPANDVIRAKLRWRFGTRDWEEMNDETYPFEFSIYLNRYGPPVSNLNEFEAVVEITNRRRQTELEDTLILKWAESDRPFLAPFGKEMEPLATKYDSDYWWRNRFRDSSPVAARTNFKITDEFTAYMQTAANPKRIGLSEDGLFRPYSTPRGNRIGWRQIVSKDEWYETGRSSAEAERELRIDLRRAANEAAKLCDDRKPRVSFGRLPNEAREMLVDFVYTEGANLIKSELVDAIIAQDWQKLIDECLYVRYYGPSPDQSRNKAFADRWIYSEKLVPLRKTP